MRFDEEDCATRRPNRHGNAAKAPSVAVVMTPAGLDALGTAACSLSRMQPWRGPCHMRLRFYFYITEKKYDTAAGRKFVVLMHVALEHLADPFPP